MISIELRDVWFRYPARKEWVLKNISTSFRSSEIVVVTGPNGSGKTTLLKIASLLYRPSRGSVYINGIDFWSLRGGEQVRYRRRVVYVHEKPILLRGTVLYNVAYGLVLRGIDEDEAMDRARAILEEIGMAHLADRDAKKLSAGQAQLVALARALVLEPEIAFLDEPLAHLDREKRKRVIELLEAFRSRGTGFVIATHSEGISQSLSTNRIIALEDGIIVESS